MLKTFIFKNEKKKKNINFILCFVWNDLPWKMDETNFPFRIDPEDDDYEDEFEDRFINWMKKVTLLKEFTQNQIKEIRNAVEDITNYYCVLNFFHSLQMSVITCLTTC